MEEQCELDELAVVGLPINDRITEANQLKLTMHNCPFCDYSTSDKMDLKKHKKTHPPGDRSQFKCPFSDCLFVTKRRIRLKPHLAAKHGDTSNLKKCPLCKYSTGENSHLKRHMITHSYNAYNCKYSDCDYSCKLKKLLDGHMASVHGDTSHWKKCPHCEYSCGNASNFRKHVAIHLPADKKSFKCKFEGCGYSSTRETLLNAHLVTKHGEKKYLQKCNLCDYATGNSLNLRRHVKAHLSAAALMEAMEPDVSLDTTSDK